MRNPHANSGGITAGSQKGTKMSSLVKFFDAFSADDSGATMVEYTILIGLITVVAIALIASVGTWVKNAWTSVNTTLAASPITT